MDDKELQEALQGDARGWRPEPGETLIGTVLFVSKCSCGGYGEHPLVEVATRDGEIVDVHAFHEVLRNGITRWGPQSGQTIGIRYSGRLNEGGSQGDGYESYRVIVQPAEPAPASS